MGDLSTGTELLSDRRPLAQSLLLSPVPPLLHLLCLTELQRGSRGRPETERAFDITRGDSRIPGAGKTLPTPSFLPVTWGGG